LSNHLVFLNHFSLTERVVITKRSLFIYAPKQLEEAGFRFIGADFRHRYHLL